MLNLNNLPVYDSFAQDCANMLALGDFSEKKCSFGLPDLEPNSHLYNTLKHVYNVLGVPTNQPFATVQTKQAMVKKYEYTEEMRQEDIELAKYLAKHYEKRLSQGISEEHARGLIPGCRRQHCVITLNARMLMHILNVRAKKNAQLEAQHLANELFSIFSDWMPQTAQWYEAHLLGKAKLAP